MMSLISSSLTRFADAHSYRSTSFSGWFSVEVNDITGSLVVTSTREFVEVQVADLTERNSVTSSDLGTFVFSHTDTLPSVNVQVSH